MGRRFIISLIGSTLINLTTWVILYMFIPRPDPSNTLGVILHYNVYFGIDLIGEWYKIFYIPASGLLILIVNTCLSLWVIQREKFLAAVLEMSALGIQVILFIAAILTIMSNLS